MTTPVRLQLSRKKGFNLQALSLATNGLPAVNCARPSKWGNPFYVINEEGAPWITDGRDSRMPVCNGDAAKLIGEPDIFWNNVQQGLVAIFRRECLDGLPNMSILRGKNLACFCKSGPCHCDVLLELANAPVCEAV